MLNPGRAFNLSFVCTIFIPELANPESVLSRAVVHLLSFLERLHEILCHSSKTSTKTILTFFLVGFNLIYLGKAWSNSVDSQRYVGI